MLKIHNTLSGKKEAFQPKKGKTVDLFICGPTVYDLAHIGHARTYIAFDVIAKYLKEKWFDVYYLQNITDIDDKIIQRAKEQNTAPKTLASRFEKEYLKDMKVLKVNSVTKYARATAHIKEIVAQIKKLAVKGFAYQIKDGAYYDISKFKDYGKLSRRTVLQAEDSISRIDESKEKKNKGDFCLWKFSKEGEPMWDFKTGRYLGIAGPASVPPSGTSAGRPGWHIEDTAITEKFFGTQYDIHGGGKDLIFPHHEAEIAQMEAISGKKPMVRYWLHAGSLTVQGKKMSKSLGNFITIQDFIKQYSPRILRFLIVKNLYRSPMNYEESLTLQAKKELAKIDDFVSRLKEVNHRLKKGRNLTLKAEREFEAAMEDDFNTPKAVAAVFNLINRQNALIDKNLLHRADAQDILTFLKKADRILGFVFWPESKIIVPQLVLNSVKHREKYRKMGQWQKADEIRKKILELGWQIEDAKTGPKIKNLH